MCKCQSICYFLLSTLYHQTCNCHVDKITWYYLLGTGFFIWRIFLACYVVCSVIVSWRNCFKGILVLILLTARIVPSMFLTFWLWYYVIQLYVCYPFFYIIAQLIVCLMIVSFMLWQIFIGGISNLLSSEMVIIKKWSEKSFFNI